MKTYTSPVAYTLLSALLLSCSAGKQSATYLEQRSEQSASAKEQDGSTYPGVASDPVLNEVIDIVRNRYVHSYTYDPNIDTTVHALLSRLDPFSYYRAPGLRDAPWYRNQSWYLGLKISIRQDTPTILCIALGSNFDGKGLLPGDRIIAVNNWNVINPHFSTFGSDQHEFVSVISSGLDSETISLKIFRPLTQEVFICSASGYLEPQYKMVYGTMLTPVTAYMTIYQFTEGVFSEVVRTLYELSLRGMKNLVLDLQNNPGGQVYETDEILSLFFDEASPLVVLYSDGRSPTGTTKTSVERGRYAKLPMVVVVNEESASASELIAGVMQDKDRALIIGATTFGKGMTVTPFYLQTEFSTVMVATSMILLPTGRNIQLPYTGNTMSEAPFKCDTFLDNRSHSLESQILGAKNTRFFTSKNRPVYEHSAVVPDYFVPFFKNRDANIYATSEDFSIYGLYDEFGAYQHLFLAYNTPSEFYKHFPLSGEGKAIRSRLAGQIPPEGALRAEVDLDAIMHEITFDLSRTLFGIYGCTSEALMNTNRISFAVSLLEPEKEVVKPVVKKVKKNKKLKQGGKS